MSKYEMVTESIAQSAAASEEIEANNNDGYKGVFIYLFLPIELTKSHMTFCNYI